MFEIFAGGAAIQNDLAADDRHALRHQHFGKLCPQGLRVVLGVGEHVDFDDLARFERVGEGADHIFIDAALPQLCHGLNIRRDAL